VGLNRETETSPPVVMPWVKAHAAGLLCVLVGLIGVAVASGLYFGGGGDAPRIPDFRLTTPALILALALAVAAVVRRERAWALPIAGVGLAGAAMVLGWAIVVGVIVLITIFVIILLSKMM
ncbi:MAG TPA: hypothetical protein VL172_07895, partial [Kofleriaceae bacterium]|nr:hypothetical protein [Kofleriaceae bacterium]